MADALAQIFDDRRALADAARANTPYPWMGEWRTSNRGVAARCGIFFIRRWGLDGGVVSVVDDFEILERVFEQARLAGA